MAAGVARNIAREVAHDFLRERLKPTEHQFLADRSPASLRTPDRGISSYDPSNRWSGCTASVHREYDHLVGYISEEEPCQVLIGLGHLQHAG
jgi:hypothetical protein